MTVRQIDLVDSASERRAAWAAVELGCNGTGEADCKTAWVDLTAQTVISDAGTALAVYAQHEHIDGESRSADTVVSLALDPSSSDLVFQVTELIAAVRANRAVFDDDAALVALVIAAYEHRVAEGGNRARVFYEKRQA